MPRGSSWVFGTVLTRPLTVASSREEESGRGANALTICNGRCAGGTCCIRGHRNGRRTASTNGADENPNDAGRCAKDMSDYKASSKALYPATAISPHFRSRMFLVWYGEAVDPTPCGRNMEGAAALHSSRSNFPTEAVLVAARLRSKRRATTEAQDHRETSGLFCSDPVACRPWQQRLATTRPTIHGGRDQPSYVRLLGDQRAVSRCSGDLRRLGCTIANVTAAQSVESQKLASTPCILCPLLVTACAPAASGTNLSNAVSNALDNDATQDCVYRSFRPTSVQLKGKIKWRVGSFRSV